MLALQKMETTPVPEWIKLQETTIPIFTIGSMTSYFISRLASDGLPANDYKDLNSHAYGLFKAGHVQSIFVSSQASKYDIKCVCLPEMRKDQVYNITLTMDSNADVLKSSCGSPAGAGPKGSCKHIAALCYALEEYCRIKDLRSPRSCTSQLQTWNQPRKRRLDSCSVDDISFIKHEYGKTKKIAESVMYDPRPSTMRSTSDSSVQSLRQNLLRTGKDLAILHLLPNPSSTPEPTPAPSSHLPHTPQILLEKVVNDLNTQPQPVHFTHIADAGLAFLNAIKYTTEQRMNIEAATRDQSESRRWFEERQYRLTASKFGLIIKRKRQHTSLASQLLHSSVNPSLSAIQWGKQHEPDALDEYVRTLSDNLTLRRSGFYIDRCGYLGASPDGIVANTDGSVIRLVEVKCPFSVQNMTVQQACEVKSFCCSIDEDTCKPYLKLDNDYYYQVQGQMGVTGIHECDFVIWTTKGIFVQTIAFDVNFWNDKCLPKLKHFYLYFLLPEIVFPKHPSPYDYSCHQSSMYVDI